MPPRASTSARPKRHRVVALVLAIVIVIAAAGSAFFIFRPGDSAEDSHPVTADEADQLALARFRNYEAGTRAVTMVVPAAGGELTINGSVNFRKHVGYGVLSGTGEASASGGLLQWTMAALAVHPHAPEADEPPATPPQGGWNARAINPQGNTLDAALLIVLNLAADRPENSQLLSRNGATWVGKTTIDGTSVDIFDGPRAQATATDQGSTGQPQSTASGDDSRVRYWVAEDGTLYKVSLPIATAPKPAIVTFGKTQDPFTVVPGLQDGGKA